MLSWCSGRTKSSFMCPTRKWHGYTWGEILQQLNKMGRQLVLGISPACPCQLTATGTNGELPVEAGASFVSNKTGWSKDPGKREEAGGLGFGGSDRTTWLTTKATQAFRRSMTAASEHLKIRNPCKTWSGMSTIYKPHHSFGTELSSSSLVHLKHLPVLSSWGCFKTLQNCRQNWILLFFKGKRRYNLHCPCCSGGGGLWRESLMRTPPSHLRGSSLSSPRAYWFDTCIPAQTSLSWFRLG